MRDPGDHIQEAISRRLLLFNFLVRRHYEHLFGEFSTNFIKTWTVVGLATEVKLYVYSRPSRCLLPRKTKGDLEIVEFQRASFRFQPMIIEYVEVLRARSGFVVGLWIVSSVDLVFCVVWSEFQSSVANSE